MKDRFQRELEEKSFLNNQDSKVSKKTYDIQGKNTNSVGYDLLNYVYQQNHQGQSQIGADMKVDLKTNLRQLKIAGHSPHGGYNLITGSGQEVTPVVVKSRRAGKNLKDVYSQEKSRRKMQFPPADNRGIFNAD